MEFVCCSSQQFGIVVDHDDDFVGSKHLFTERFDSGAKVAPAIERVGTNDDRNFAAVHYRLPFSMCRTHVNAVDRARSPRQRNNAGLPSRRASKSGKSALSRTMCRDNAKRSSRGELVAYPTAHADAYPAATTRSRT